MTEKQFLDVEGLKTFSDAIKDGSLVAGTSAKADEADSVPWSGVTDKPSKFPAETHTHTPAEAGIEPIPDSTIEAIISGTYSE